MYTEYVPSPLLAPYIDNYWEFKGAVSKGMHFNILPDGCTDFIFTLGEATHADNCSLVMQPYRSYFVGSMTTYAKLTAHSDTIDMFGIRFRPCGVSPFVEFPLHEFTDNRVQASDLNTLFNDSITDMLCEKTSIWERIEFIEGFLLEHLCRKQYEVDKSILYAVARINNHQGKLPIRALADDVNLCQRHFERKFKGLTGVSPKEYSRIVQFQNAVELLRNAEFDNLLSVAVQSGYYDVPHLSREIKRLSGSTPIAFLSGPEPKEVTLTYIHP